MRCLLVDSSGFVCTQVSGYLTQRGIEVKVAQTGAEAIELTNTYSPDTIIIDVLLPDADGVEILKKLRARCPISRIIVASQSLAKDQVARMIQSGMKEIWLKPYCLDSLVEKISL